VLFMASVALCLILFATATRNLDPDERPGLFSSSSLSKPQAEQVMLDAKLNPCTSQHDAEVLFVTSITRPFRDHAAKRNWKGTLWQHSKEQQMNTKRPPLWVFTENTWETSHGREPLSTKDLPFADCVLDVFEVLPKALADTAAVDSFYKIPGTPGLNTRIMDGKVLMRKVAAIAHALAVAKDGAIVIWVDVDVVPLRPLDERFIEFVKSKDVSYLAETLCWRDLDTVEGYATLPDSCLDFRIDTGVVGFRVSRKTRTFAEWWIGAYSSSPGRMLSLARLCFQNTTLEDDEERELISFFARGQSRVRSQLKTASDLCGYGHIRSNIGLNDIYTFALALHSFGSEIDHGWFAYKATGCNVAFEHMSNLPGGHCHPCIATADSVNSKAVSLVSSFQTREYLNHVKGGSAIMARQHTERFEPDIKGVFTSDPELLLPQEYFPISSHVDHRMACDDKRSKYGQVWSLKQLKK